MRSFLAVAMRASLAGLLASDVAEFGQGGEEGAAGLGADAGNFLQEGVGGVELRIGVDEAGGLFLEIGDLFFEEFDQGALLTEGERGGVMGGLVVGGDEEVEELVATGEEFAKGVAERFARLSGSGAHVASEAGEEGEAYGVVGEAADGACEVEDEFGL